MWISIQHTHQVEIANGAMLTLSTNNEYFSEGTSNCVYVDYEGLPRVVRVGSLIYIDDGLLKFVVAEIGDDYVIAKAENGGWLGPRKCINIPDADVDLPPLSKRDV
ncbi:pyruvate kinase, barrel domain-containing protein, partial [Sphaeroforma arctica JP610]